MSIPLSVPPSVRFPLLVTDPPSVIPLTLPVPPTLVTVPALLVYPLGLVAGYAPRLDSASVAVVAPVPPLLIGIVLSDILNVPLLLIGPPVITKSVEVIPTLVTVPVLLVYPAGLLAA